MRHNEASGFLGVVDEHTLRRRHVSHENDSFFVALTDDMAHDGR